MKQKVLLQIDSCRGILSTGRITESIATLAISRGWECYIAHGARYVGDSIQHSYQITTKKEEYLHYIESLLLDNHGLNSTLATKAFIRYIKKIKPDVIHLHCIHGYYLNYKLLFKFLNSSNIPVVWTQHDCWGFTGHCSHFVSIGCDKWKNGGCRECKLKNRYPKALIDRSSRNYRIKKEFFTRNKQLIIVSVSQWLNGLVSQSFLSKYPHAVIYNGIDTKIFQPRKSKLRDRFQLNCKKVLLAVASSWGLDKGLNDYVQLSYMLPDDYQIVLVGISEQIRKNIPANIICLPRTSNLIELAELYSMADVVLNLSYAETFGLTTVEGMACGTPGIVYDRTASPELVTKETGLIVKAGNLEALVKAIAIITSNGKDTYSTACREWVLTNFDMDYNFTKYVNLYESLIAGNLNCNF